MFHSIRGALTPEIVDVLLSWDLHAALRRDALELCLGKHVESFLSVDLVSLEDLRVFINLLCRQA